jgi:iron complex outermembrane receptor protein
VQDHLKLKLACEFGPSLRAAYTFGLWQNDSERAAQSYLRDAAGHTVSSGVVNIAGRDYTLSPSDFATTSGRQEHLVHGLNVKSQTRSTWDWEFAASLYDYRRDEQRTSTGALTDMAGTGWNTLALKGIWRPEGVMHTVEAGVQRDAFKLRSGGSQVFEGNTTLSSLWAQDAWHLSPEWRVVAGLRAERWQAFDGQVGANPLGERAETWWSPKAALAWRPGGDWTFKASLGRAVRAPTVAELYQGSAVGNVVVNNDPDLRPETSWTTEWTAERSLRDGQLRATVFAERTRDALYSQTNVSITPNVTNIQNVDAIRTRGFELAAQSHDVGVRGLDLAGSLTFADSVITRNDKFPASVGHWQPRVPRWRANLLATWREGERWSGSLGLRYSGRQYGTLDNGDPNGATYTGVSDFLVADLRFVYRFDRQWSASVGVDNLNDERYWAFHPYTRRTFSAELKFDL